MKTPNHLFCFPPSHLEKKCYEGWTWPDQLFCFCFMTSHFFLFLLFLKIIKLKKSSVQSKIMNIIKDSLGDTKQVSHGVFCVCRKVQLRRRSEGFKVHQHGNAAFAFFRALSVLYNTVGQSLGDSKR